MTTMRLSHLMLPDIEAAFREDPSIVRELFDDLHAEDVADIIERAELELGCDLLEALEPLRAADVLACIEPTRQREQIRRLGPERAASIVNEMASDERADLLGLLESSVAEALLARLAPEEAADARKLGAFAEDTVGSVMSTEVLMVDLDMSVQQVIDRVRAGAEEAETIHYVYVVDGTSKLVGVVSLRELILARGDERVADIMREDLKSVSPNADQEEAASLIGHYDLIALPVVDQSHALLGVVTVDDVVDVLKEEATEDMHKMAAVKPLEASYFHTDFWTFIKKRAPWLIVLFVGELFTGDAIKLFDHVVQYEEGLLVLFLPLIVSSGGNSGSQSATIIIRALAIGEVGKGHARRVFTREIVMGIVLGLMLSAIGVVRALIWDGTGADVALAVGITLIAVVMLGTVVGAMMPIMLSRLGLDPAVSSTPFIASLVDILGIVTYFSIAGWILLG